MSAITFPNSPSAGEQWTINGITYTFTDGTWVAVGQSNFYTLPIGSPTVLGGVKGGGTGITIANDGVISFSGTTFDTSDVDSHLNQSNPTSGYVLSWNGTDYAWVEQSSSGTTYDLTASDGSVATEEKILLTGSDTSEDAVTLAVSGNLTIARSNNTITFGGGGATTTINNNADNRIITGSATTGELNAEDSLSYDGTKLNFADDKKITFGNNLRMEIYTDGTTNYIKTPTDGDSPGAFPISIHSGNLEVITIDDGATEIKTELTAGGDITVKMGLKDKDSQLGTSGQVLTSTGTQVDWVDASTLSTSSSIPAFQSSWRIPL